MVKVGDKIKIDIKGVIKYDNIPQYLKLVRKVIRNSKNGYVYVSRVQAHGLTVRAWELDFLGDVFVPFSAVKCIKDDNKSFGDKLLYGN